MSILKIRVDGVWQDACDTDIRFRIGSSWVKFKPNDRVYVNGSWVPISCAQSFKWIIPPEAISCETSRTIIDVPITLASPQYLVGSSRIDIQPLPGSTIVFKKNVVTGNYILDLKWIEVNTAGVGPAQFNPGFSGGLPGTNPYVIGPIAQISDPTLYPSVPITLYGTGNSGLTINGHIDIDGKIWLDSAPSGAIVAWNPANPIYSQRVYNLDASSEFGGLNPIVNTGWAISLYRLKVTNNSLNLPLDVNNQFTSISGLPQDQQPIDVTDVDYRTYQPGRCALPNPEYGNLIQSAAFIRNNCPPGFEGSSVTYTVPANTFYASTQAAADALAIAKLNAEGQDNANLLGTCTELPFITLNYQTIYGLDPFVWNGITMRRNSVYVSRIESETSGSLTDVFRVGDTIDLRQICFPGNFPPPPTSKWNFNIKVNGVDVYNQDRTVPVIELQNHTFVIVPGTTVIDVISTGSSTDLGYKTYGLEANNFLAQDDLKIKLLDNTDGEFVIEVEPKSGTSNFQFNVHDDGALMSSVVTNQSALSASAELIGTSYTDTEVLSAGSAQNLSDVPKAFVIVNFESGGCTLSVGFDITNEDATHAAAEALPSGGVGPYTYLWSNGQTTKTATGLLKDTEYTCQVTDTGTGCVVTEAVTPNIEVLSGLKIELMYFNLNTTVTTDPYYPRIGAVGGHSCNRARFEVFANSISQGIANLNNAGGTNPADGTIDDGNRSPLYPSGYDNSDPLDRYWSKTFSGADAAAIAGPGGTVTFTTVWTGIPPEVPHSDASWLRITKEDNTVLLSTTIDAFTSYEFDPYA